MGVEVFYFSPSPLVNTSQEAVYRRHCINGWKGRLSVCVCVCMCVCVPMFETPWTVVRQASLSMEFSRQEYWSGFLTEGLNPGLPHCRQILYYLSPPGKHIYLLPGFIWKLEFITFTDNFDSGFYKWVVNLKCSRTIKSVKMSSKQNTCELRLCTHTQDSKCSVYACWIEW